MKYLFTILIVALTIGDLDKIAAVNRLKKEAKEAYLKGDYETALSKYQYLVDSLNIEDDNITLNLANAYYHTKDTTQAVNNYSSLLDSKSKLVRSTASQQLGVISTRNKKFEEALDHFKEALRADPGNEDARYNYEMMKKILKEQEQQQQQQNQDQQNQQDQQQQNQDQQQNKDQQDQNQDQQQDQQSEQNKDQEGEEQEKEQQEGEEQKQEEKGEQKEEEQQKPEPQEGEESEEQEQQDEMNSISEKLEEMKISEEKARMILEALKNKEIQYYQQNKRKPTKRKDPKKPDW